MCLCYDSVITDMKRIFEVTHDVFSGFPSNDVFTDDRFLSLREVYEQ